MFFSKMTDDPPDIPGIPGHIARFAHKFRRATQIFPPFGVGVGAGIGMGCGFGWPLRQAHGPPRALCGPSIGVGVGLGYGQGFGRRFGRDTRPEAIKGRMGELERFLDQSANSVLSPVKQFFLPPSRVQYFQDRLDDSVSAVVTPVQGGMTRLKQQIRRISGKSQDDHQSSSSGAVINVTPDSLLAANVLAPHLTSLYRPLYDDTLQQQQHPLNFGRAAVVSVTTPPTASGPDGTALARLSAKRDLLPVQIKRC